ncbi:energy transducer TonB [Sphingomonas sp. J344]|uniref:energy transducer TonB n=1 Tax=Sphingomonas sp. J344 TaxID=2898434 RepID=UPI0021516E9E|nr:energy transducer TonB [Sphingomonas sp. J344]MCR5872156.1 energy transducer TonB [Sphingomonas sp. J344]
MVAILSHRRERAGGAAAAAALTLGLGALLVAGLAVRAQVVVEEDGMALFRVAPDAPPPPEAIRAPQRDTRPEGEAAPPNLTSRATPVVVPEPMVPLPLPPPLLPVAEKAADSSQATSGAADVPGPGSGAGGQGDGFGAGGSGDGRGAGDPDATPPRWIRGDIRDSDYPEDLADAGIGGRVTVLYLVETNGRVSDCDVVGSSGVPRLDALTCRLIRERFRFRPSRSGAGEAGSGADPRKP